METSDMVGKAMGHAEELMEEARKWDSIAEEGGSLGTVMDESMSRVAGVDSTNSNSTEQLGPSQS